MGETSARSLLPFLPRLPHASVGFCLGCLLVLSGCDDQPTEPPPPPPAPSYDIEIRYVPGTEPTAEVQQRLEEASQRWERVITGDLPSLQVTEPAPRKCEKVTIPPMDEVVDDLVVWVEIGPLDGQGGFGGFAGVCHTRSDHLPAVSSILFDEADFIGETLAAHEFGHAVGFGEVWLEMGLLVDPVNPRNGGPGALEPVADATIAEGSPDTNFGLPGASPLTTNLVVGKNLGAWTSGPDEEELRALLRWDLSGLRPAAPITEARLIMSVSEQAGPTTGARVDLGVIRHAWEEESVTWTTQPMDSVVRQVGQLLNSPVQDWLDGRLPNYGFSFRLHEFDATDASFGYFTRHAAESTQRPKLSIHLDTHFRGTNAIAQFDALGGAAYPGPKVPVENDYFDEGELVDGHWRSFFMTAELMSAQNFMTASLSRITVGALEDMGYEVDYTNADAFEVNNVP